MVETIQCPYCGQEIETDSRYCDQCGGLLYVCPSCRKIGKGQGKRCGNCGKALVAATEASITDRPPLATPQTATPHCKTIDAQQAPNQPRPTSLSPSAIECSQLNIRLQLMQGAIIGRTTGNYSNLLSNCIYISGTHARIDFDGQTWTITDLHSRNGTKVNGIPCSPTLPLKVGDIIRFASSYDFKVI